KNVSSGAIDLGAYSVELVNGTGGGGALYQTIDLPGQSLAPGGYFVICASAATVPGCALDVSPDTNLIQNGAPDAVAIRDGGALVDAVSYEGDSGAPYTEGSGIGLNDDPGPAGKGLSRCADGLDTDQNNTDLIFAAITPGAANSCPAAPLDVAIHDIQGAAHVSPLDGQAVTTDGIVTAVASNGFYLQEPDAAVDASDATSEGIFVFTGSAPPVAIGDEAGVTGTVSEFRPGGSRGSANLTTTEIVSPAIDVVSGANPLPATATVGAGGRVPPGEVIDDDASGSVETGGLFEPGADGIDFYESLEGMLLRVNDPVATGPTNDFGEISVLPDNGTGAVPRTGRGGIIVGAGDFNPERIIIDDALTATPVVNTGDGFTGPSIGVLSYSFGNFKLNVTSPLAGVDRGLVPETAEAARPGALAVATFNVENLDPSDPPEKFQRLARQIVDNLASPDLIALDEVQDDNGPANDSVVGADATFAGLIAAIEAAGGPAYSFRQINPVDDQDGGQPGGNIRVGFLFRGDRGLSFTDHPGGGSTTGTTVIDAGGTPELSASPGRLDPTNTAFDNSRKPLAGEFLVNA
ncbi:MAG: hypothetical protein WAP37_08490, partial [Solirubrobacterales bacterium]